MVGGGERDLDLVLERERERERERWGRAYLEDCEDMGWCCCGGGGAIAAAIVAAAVSSAAGLLTIFELIQMSGSGCPTGTDTIIGWVTSIVTYPS